MGITSSSGKFSRRQLLPMFTAIGLPIAFPVLLQVEAKDEAESHWSYEGREGPEYWGDLDAEFSSCRIGQEQSPVNIVAADEVSTPDIVFRYQTLNPISMVNNGHTVQVLGTPADGIEIEDEWFELQQFHFHTPSEHRVAGELADMEVHFVHESAAGGSAAVGILINQGGQNLPLAQIFDSLPTVAGPVQVVKGEVDLSAVLPLDRSTFRYQGSLTTPPCTEGLQWFVMREPIEMSAAQIAAFTAIFDMNARPIQPLNDREIIDDEMS